MGQRISIVALLAVALGFACIARADDDGFTGLERCKGDVAFHAVPLNPGCLRGHAGQRLAIWGEHTHGERG